MSFTGSKSPKRFTSSSVAMTPLVLQRTGRKTVRKIEHSRKVHSGKEKGYYTLANKVEGTEFI